MPWKACECSQFSIQFIEMSIFKVQKKNELVNTTIFFLVTLLVKRSLRVQFPNVSWEDFLNCNNINIIQLPNEENMG